MSASEGGKSARVRVFLPTYRRNAMLPRALASLQAQTVEDWVCELHNDDPSDRFPGDYVARLGDPRIQLHNHAQNLGPTKTFHLFYRATAEPFFALLEDDNWWEPRFLEEMLRVAEENPDVAVVWSNMRIWAEQPDGSFRDTGKFVATETTGPPIRVSWGSPRQIFGALYSNSSALIRARIGADLLIPDVPSATVEFFRERLFPFPLIRVRQPLVNFAITRSTSRSDDHAEWAVVQTMLAATFLKHAGYSPARMAQICDDARAARPSSMPTLLLAAIVEPACRGIRSHAHFSDWYRLARSAIRRPWVLLRVMGSRRRHADWWEFLDRNTALRFREAGNASDTRQIPSNPEVLLR